MQGKREEIANVPTTLLCIFLAPVSTTGVFEGFLVKAVAAAAIDSPALERSVRRKVEANRLGDFRLIYYQTEQKEERGREKRSDVEMGDIYNVPRKKVVARDGVDYRIKVVRTSSVGFVSCDADGGAAYRLEIAST